MIYYDAEKNWKIFFVILWYCNKKIDKMFWISSSHNAHPTIYFNTELPSQEMNLFILRVIAAWTDHAWRLVIKTGNVRRACTGLRTQFQTVTTGRKDGTGYTDFILVCVKARVIVRAIGGREPKAARLPHWFALRETSGVPVT
jgi:hypothetical protein